MTARRPALAPIVMAAVLALSSACGDAELTPDEAQARVFEALELREHAAARGHRFSSLADLLANTKYQAPGGAPASLTEAVIVGDVVEVQAGAGFRDVSDDPAVPGDGLQVAFDDRSAAWRTVHLRVRVDEVISGNPELQGTEVFVGLAFGPSPDLRTLRHGLEAVDRGIFFLVRSPVFDYDPAVYATVNDGALVGLVDDEGSIDLPALEEEVEAQLLSEAATVDELRDAADDEERVVETDASGVPRDRS